MAAIATTGQGAYAQETIVTDATAPGRPLDMVVCGISEDELALSWSAPKRSNGKEITAYSVEARTASAAGFPPGIWQLSEHAGTDATVSGLSSATLYDVRVAAVNEVGASAFAEASVATQALPTEEAPLRLTICAAAPDALDVSWKESSTNMPGMLLTRAEYSEANLSQFRLEFRPIGMEEWTRVQVLQGDYHALIGNLIPSTTYEVRLGALRDAGAETFVRGGAATQAATPPDAPLALSLKARSSASVELTWLLPPNDGGLAISAYEVEYRETDTNVGIGGNQPGDWNQSRHTSLQVTIGSLTPGTSYDVQVAAINDAGIGPFSRGTISTRPSPELERDWLVLRKLYTATDGPNWSTGEDWSSSEGHVPSLEELGAWSGVTTSRGRVTELRLSGYGLRGVLPEALGDLTELYGLWIGNNFLTATLPASLMRLKNLTTLHFGDQELCAQRDDAFQQWLEGIMDREGDNCPEHVSFVASIDDQQYEEGIPIEGLVLPQAVGGTPPYAYTISPQLPPGLVFHAGVRFLTGTPLERTVSTIYTLTATDQAGSTAITSFAIEVIGQTLRDTDVEMPEKFAVLGNYPNPFNPSTRVVF